MSLKVIQTSTIWKLGCGFLLAVSLTVYKIFSVKNSMTLKTGLVVVQGHWNWRRSIDHNAIFNWCDIVNVALLCTVFELFDVE